MIVSAKKRWWERADESTWYSATWRTECDWVYQEQRLRSHDNSTALYRKAGPEKIYFMWDVQTTVVPIIIETLGTISR